MGIVTIYGASDDLIEIEGDLVEEFNPSSDEPSYLAFNDGTVLSVEYGKGGLWRIHRLNEGTAIYAHKSATDPDDDYTDRVMLSGVKCVVFGSRYEKIKQKAAAKK